MDEVKVYANENHSVLGENTKHEEETVDIIEYFGKYISDQYEVLERTLSFLKIDDLISASLVSNSWKKVSERLLRKREKLRWHIHNKSMVVANHDYKNKINFETQFVLGIQSRKSRVKNVVLNELIENDSYICSGTSKEVKKGRNIPGLLDGNMILVQSSGIEIPYYAENNELKFLGNSEAGIFFPKLKGLRIFTIPLNVGNDEFNFPLPLLRGILTLSPDGEYEALENALNNMKEDLEEPIAVGGGVFNNIKTFSQDLGVLKKNKALINICFCGENVSCHSEVLCRSGKDQTEEFLIKMKNTMGSFDPKKQQRIAIVVRCVARTNTEYENTLFKKNFPDVPAFILLSEGEYGYQSAAPFEDDAPVSKKRRQHILSTHCYSVVYFFVTINLCS